MTLPPQDLCHPRAIGPPITHWTLYSPPLSVTTLHCGDWDLSVWDLVHSCHQMSCVTVTDDRVSYTTHQYTIHRRWKCPQIAGKCQNKLSNREKKQESLTYLMRGACQSQHCQQCLQRSNWARCGGVGVASRMTDSASRTDRWLTGAQTENAAPVEGVYLCDPGQCVDLWGSVIRVVAPHMVSEAGLTHYMASEVGFVRCGVDSPEARWGGHLLRPYPLAMTPDKVHWNLSHYHSPVPSRSLSWKALFSEWPHTSPKRVMWQYNQWREWLPWQPPATHPCTRHGKHKHILDY